MYYFYFPYQGGKTKDFKNIYDLVDISKFNVVVEPFCGSCAISLNFYVKHKELSYHVNDIDETLISFLKDVKVNGSNRYFKYVNDILQEYTNEKHNKIIEKYKKTPSNLKYWFYYRKIYNIRPGLFDKRRNEKSSIDISKYIVADTFFKNAKITCKDYTKILNKYVDESDVFIFLDPPYLDSCNSSYTSSTKKNQVSKTETCKKDNTKIYIDILNFLRICKCGVLMIINDNSINRYIYNDYIKDSYLYKYRNTSISTGTKNITSHLIICKNID